MTLTPARLIALIFFLQPIAYGSWLSRIPDLRDRIGLGPAELALDLLGAPIGILATLTFSGALVARIGSRATIIFGFVAFLAVVSGPAFASSATGLFVALAVLGATMAVLELGLNVEADQIETRSGRLIMSTCHGFWSLGLLVGSLIGAAFAALPITPQWGMVGLAAAMVLPSLGAAYRLPGEAPRLVARQGSALFRPARRLVAIAAFVFGVALTEGAAADWAAILMRDAFKLPTGLSALGFAPFGAMVAAGRFAGDGMNRRFGAVRVARVACGTALVGAVVLVASRQPALALLGLALLGLGVSTGFPLAVSAAAGLGDRAPAANVAFLSMIALAGFLAGPTMIGGVAQHVGIQLGLAAVIPGLVLSLACAGAVRRA